MEGAFFIFGKAIDPFRKISSKRSQCSWPSFVFKHKHDRCLITINNTGEKHKSDSYRICSNEILLEIPVFIFFIWIECIVILSFCIGARLNGYDELVLNRRSDQASSGSDILSESDKVLPRQDDRIDFIASFIMGTDFRNSGKRKRKNSVLMKQKGSRQARTAEELTTS